MKEEISAGYESPHEEKEPSSEKLWTLKKIPALLHGGIVAHLLCDLEPRAVLQLVDEEEFEWLRKRIDGTQPLSQGSVLPK